MSSGIEEKNSDRNRDRGFRKAAPRRGSRLPRRTFDEWYIDAKRYYDAHGDLLVPAKYKTPEGYGLGKWIYAQRAKHNGKPSAFGALSDAEARLLEEIGMVWHVEYRFPWDEWMREVRAYRDAHGDIDIPRDYKTGNFHLGNWIAERREDYWAGRLSEAQIADLEECGVSWAIGFRRGWEEWYADAARYYEEHGNLLVPLGYRTPEGFDLGGWISEQRGKRAGQSRKGKRTLTGDEVAWLDAIGMVWSVAELRGDRWEENFAAVRAFCREQGRKPTKARDGALPDGKSMHYWICAQREAAAKGRLAPERAERLREIGIGGTPREGG